MSVLFFIVIALTALAAAARFLFDDGSPGFLPALLLVFCVLTVAYMAAEKPKAFDFTPAKAEGAPR